jgi:hypothetical protein
MTLIKADRRIGAMTPETTCRMAFRAGFPGQLVEAPVDRAGVHVQGNGR